MRQKLIFFLGPRLIDFDAFLPLAMALKNNIPNIDIRFITFSESHYRYLMKNSTLMEGVRRCGKIYFFSTEGNNSVFLSILKIALVNIRILCWILTSKKPLIFSDKEFSKGFLARFYLASKINFGKGIVVLRARIIESCLIPEQIDEFNNDVQEPIANWVSKYFGRSKDGVISFHDEQELFTRIYVPEKLKEKHRYINVGLLTLDPVWRKLITDESVKHLKYLNELYGDDDNRKIFSLFAGKSMQSRWLKTKESIALSFENTIKVIIKNYPNAIILIRPHPAGLNETFIKKSLDKYKDFNIRLDFSHPDVQCEISDHVIFTAPTNIMSTSLYGRRIDCIDYSESTIKKYNSKSPYHELGVFYADPTSLSFDKNFISLVESKCKNFNISDMNNKFILRNKPKSIQLKAYLDSI